MELHPVHNNRHMNNSAFMPVNGMKVMDVYVMLQCARYFDA